MKLIYKFSFLLLIVVFFGCQKLDRELNTDINQQQLQVSYNSSSNLLNGIYAELRDGFLEIDAEALMASTTDEAEHTNEASSVQLFNQGAWNATNNPADVWNGYFRAIRKVNFFLETVAPSKVNLDAFATDPVTKQLRLDEIRRWGYEARFLRAFFYAELIKRYGGVPIITKTLNDEDAILVKRNSLDSCVNFVVRECDSAMVNLPRVYVTGDLGRATKVAAMALKSRVLLYAASDLFNTATWAGGYANVELINMPSTVSRADRWLAAANAAKAAIDTLGVNSLTTNYRTLFTSATLTSNEVIFTRRNAASSAFEIANFPIGFDKGNSGTTPSQNLVDAYEVKTNATTSVPFNWANPLHAANPYATTGTTARDPRLALTVAYNGASFSTVAGQTRALETWIGGRDAAPIVNATKTGYYLRKFINEGANLTTNQGPSIHTWIYIRLAELYLNYAEALNEVNPTHPDIATFVNRVRARTGIAMPPIVLGSQLSNQQRIRNERRIELAFEDHRAWDARRWMIANTVFAPDISGVRVVRDPATLAITYTPQVVESRVFNNRMYLFPLPQRELNTAAGMVQNPLW